MIGRLSAIIENELAAAFAAGQVQPAKLAQKIFGKHTDAVREHGDKLVLKALTEDIRRRCKESAKKSEQAIFPGFPELPRSVAVPAANAREPYYIGVARASILELRAGIALLEAQIVADRRACARLKNLLRRCLAAGATDDDIVGSVMRRISVTEDAA